MRIVPVLFGLSTAFAFALASCGGSSSSDNASHDAGATGGKSGSGGQGATGGSAGTGGQVVTGGTAGLGGQGAAGGTGGEAGQGVDPTCGAPGQTCCIANSCQAGGCCVETKCVSNGSDCGDGLGTCSNGSCGTCGGAGQKCCAEQMAEGCSSVGKNCGGCTQAGTGCPDYKIDATCITCGGDGQPCCGVGECIGEFALCISGTCSSKCGHPGEPCCEGSHPWPPTCRNGGCCISDSSKPFSMVCVDSSTCGCTAGTCTTCGVIDAPCCDGHCQIGQGQCSGVSGTAGKCENPPPP